MAEHKVNQNLNAHSTSIDIETHPPNLSKCTSSELEEYIRLRSTPLKYAGRLGGNQEFIVNPSDPDTQSLLKRIPDAAPWLSVTDIFSLAGFRQPAIWKPAILEGFGTMGLCYITILLAASPPLNIQPLPVPDTPSGVFGTVLFLGPLVGSITNVIVISLFVFTFGIVSGGHLNPLITIATFFARLTTLPRMVLYVGFQISGAVLAGLLVRASMNSTNFKVGGCFFDPSLVTSGQHFAIEFTSSLTLLFLAFGVGLDPRQASAFGPALAPILVGGSLGVVSLASAFSIPGFGGAGMNPGRCTAVWIGSGRSLGVTGSNADMGYTGPNGGRLWVYYIGPLAAAIAHGIVYQLLPPRSGEGRKSSRANSRMKDV